MEDSERNDMTHRLSSSTGTSSSSLSRSANRLDLPLFTSSSSLPRGHYRNFPPPSFSPETGKRSGIPPTHPNIPPHSPYFPAAAAARSPPPAANGFGPHHSRSISQPPLFSLDSLPPFSDSASPSDAPAAEAAPPLARTSSGRSAGDGLPPRKAHRRSQSDIPFGFLSSAASPHVIPQGFGSAARQSVKQESDRLSGDGRKSDGDPVSDDLVSAYMNLDSLDTLNSSEDQRASSENEGDSSSVNENPEFKEGHKRSATRDPIPGHSRSLSIDSFVGKLNFGDESLKLPPSPANPIGAQHSRSGSMDGMLSTFSLEFGNGEFNASELKKIMANEKLAEVALADPKRAKRILANRLSAARSKERKMKYISELEHKVQTLQTEATTLSAQLTMLQKDSSGLTSQNNELKFRLQAMEQQAQLREALNEALTSEVQRLKLATGENGETHLSNSLNQQIQLNPQMFQVQQFQKQQQQQQQQQSVQFSLYQLQAQHQRNNSSIKNQSSE